MAKFIVEVTAKSEVTYTVEVEASTDAEAEKIATDDKYLPDDFGNPDYVNTWEADVERQTANCEECGKEYDVPTGRRTQADCPEACPEDWEYCVDCGAKITAELAAKDAALAKAK